MALQPEYKNCISGHEVQIEHFAEGYTDDPECLPEYAVYLTGDCYHAGWLMLERDLHLYVANHRLS